MSTKPVARKHLAPQIHVAPDLQSPEGADRDLIAWALSATAGKAWTDESLGAGLLNQVGSIAKGWALAHQRNKFADQQAVETSSTPTELTGDTGTTQASAILPSTARTLYVVDANVGEWQSIVAELGDEREVLVLDTASNGLDQLTVYLEGQAGLYDAVHILSHGAEALLQLGSTALTLQSLSDERVQASLSQLGESLTAQGDIFLYGCDVAKGDSGRTFVNQFALLTGADIAASNDLTGPAGFGDWSLEYQAGYLDSVPVTISEVFSSLSYTTSGWLNFNLDNEPIWLLGGIDLSQDIFGFESPTFTYQSGEAPGGGTYSAELNELTVGLFLNAGVSGGAFDLNYPVQYSVETATVAHTGTQTIIDTDLLSIQNPSLSLDGPGISLALVAAITADLSFDLETSILGLDFVAGVDFNSGLEFTLFDIADYASFGLENEIDIGPVTLAWDMNPDAMDADLALQYSGVNFRQLSVVGSNEDQNVKLIWDIDDSIPQTVLWDQEVDVAGWGELEYGALSLDAYVGASIYLSAETHIEGVGVNLTSRETNQSFSGMLGDYFAFDVPVGYAQSALTIDADYSLIGDIEFEWGIKVEGGIEFKLGEFRFETDGFLPGFGAEWSLLSANPYIEAFFPMGSLTHDLSGYGSFQETYTILVDDDLPVDQVIPDEIGSPPSIITANLLEATKDNSKNTDTYTINEGNFSNTIVTIQLIRSNGIFQAGTVEWELLLGNEVDYLDFPGLQSMAGSVNFGIGETTKSFTLSLLGDLIAEFDESIFFLLTSEEFDVQDNTIELIVKSDDGKKFYSSPGINIGTFENDWFVESSESSEFRALSGNDTIHAGTGSDTVDAGAGNDTITIAIDGGDSVDGGLGTDRLSIDGTNYVPQYGPIHRT